MDSQAAAHEPPPPDPVEEMLKQMSIGEKIGQMMIIGVHGNAVNEDSLFMLVQYHIGGVIFYDGNMDSREQVKNFVAELNARSEQKVPLFVAVDEEGGTVARMKNDLPPPPSQASIGAGGNPADAQTYAKMTGLDLKRIGFNINFAPVADVGAQSSRNFGANPALVADFVSNAATGYEQAGIFYCLKHFPGIGRGVVDSHKEVSTIDASRENLEEIDFVPFKKTIAEHDNSKFMVMVGHLKYSALDPENSASLSPIVIKDILRDKLGFKGVIITDSLSMGATANHHSFRELGVASIKAGADIALVSDEYWHEEEIFLGLLEAVESGEIPEERINESVRRILKMKLALQQEEKNEQ